MLLDQGPLPGLASILLAGSVAAAILPPGYPAYIGAYGALAAACLAVLAYGWRERATFRHPTSLAIMSSVALVALTVPFVHRGGQDILAPVLILPMFATIALGLLARPAGWIPGPTIFALTCLVASLVAFLGGVYEHYALGVHRSGLGNNPIHYGSLAAMVGCLAMVGITASASPWRYGFFLGPVSALGAASIADSRGPLAGVVAMTGIGTLTLLVWLWRDPLFRLVTLTTFAVALAGLVYLAASGDSRIVGLLQNGLDIFRFTGGPDDIRAALYASALEMLKASAIVGVGLGQIMPTAEALFPDLVSGYGLENLHADWANFAAMAGGLGLLAWLLLLLAPLLLLLNPEARTDRPIVLGAILLTTGQFALGVSNATFGILPQTTLYAVAIGYFLVRARRITTNGPR